MCQAHSRYSIKISCDNDDHANHDDAVMDLLCEAGLSVTTIRHYLWSRPYSQPGPKLPSGPWHLPGWIITRASQPERPCIRQLRLLLTKAQPGWLQQHKFIVSQLWDQKSKSKVSAGLVLSEAYEKESVPCPPLAWWCAGHFWWGLDCRSVPSSLLGVLRAHARLCPNFPFM